MIVDDHPAVREGLRLILTTDGGCDVVASSGTCRGALDHLEEQNPDVALIDIHLPDGSGFDLGRMIKLHRPGCKVLLYSAQDEATCAGWAMQCGADGYIDKSAEPARIRAAVHKVHSGELLFRPEALAQQLQNKRNDVGGLQRLTAREFEVFFQLGWGQNTKEIAATLDISPRTAETHHRNIRKKLGVPHHDALIRLATIVFAIDNDNAASVRRDANLLDRFRRQLLSRAEWTHEAHIRVAFLLQARQPFSVALSEMTDGIRALNDSHNNPGGYHETTTQAWMRLLRRVLENEPIWLHSDAFLEAHPELLDTREPLLVHYSPELLDSPEARRDFVEPDRTPLP